MTIMGNGSSSHVNVLCSQEEEVERVCLGALGTLSPTHLKFSRVGGQSSKMINASQMLERLEKWRCPVSHFPTGF